MRGLTKDQAQHLDESIADIVLTLTDVTFGRPIWRAIDRLSEGTSKEAIEAIRDAAISYQTRSTSAALELRTFVDGLYEELRAEADRTLADLPKAQPKPGEAGTVEEQAS
jgi:hypothetical protein